MKLFGYQIYFHKHKWQWQLKEYRGEHSNVIEARLNCVEDGCQYGSAKGVITICTKSPSEPYRIDTTFDTKLTKTL